MNEREIEDVCVSVRDKRANRDEKGEKKNSTDEFVVASGRL